jgi:6-pyruvoyltetrahydropterin/6-carboxytetrahydropterin synthase
MMIITKDFTFEAAHFLPLTPAGHKCRRMHGHSFKAEISVRGAVRDDGMVIDFADITTAMAPLLQQIDHNLLNEVSGLENPTSENIALWLESKLQDALPGLCAVVVHETCTCRAEIRR